jgi:hypothetical protein
MQKKNAACHSFPADDDPDHCFAISHFFHMFLSQKPSSGTGHAGISSMHRQMIRFKNLIASVCDRVKNKTGLLFVSPPLF